MNARVLAPEDAALVPWRNGGGTTRELALWPPGASFAAGDFDWRLAQARIGAEGPFSEFAGFERLLVLLAGPGCVLVHGGVERRIAALEPYRFAGELATTARLPGGPVEDLNLLVRRERASADMRVLAFDAGEAQSLPAAEHALVYAVRGHLSARVEGDVLRLSEKHLLWCRAEPGEVHLKSAGAALAVALCIGPALPSASQPTQAPTVPAPSPSRFP